jgi:valyl-tRNA synthetase
LYGEDAARREPVLRILHYVFANALLLLHPMMPFITEELWHALGYGSDEEFIMRARWPQPLPPAALARWGVSPEVVSYVGDKYDLIRLGRTLRSDYEIPAARKVSFLIKPSTPEAARRLEADASTVQTLLRAAALTFDSAFVPAHVTPSAVNRLGTIYLPIAGLVDAARETGRLAAQRAKVEADLERTAAKLHNMDFISKAPPEVVEQQRARQQELLERAAKLKMLLEALADLQA